MKCIFWTNYVLPTALFAARVDRPPVPNVTCLKILFD